jgi:hypothetical protein
MAPAELYAAPGSVDLAIAEYCTTLSCACRRLLHARGDTRSAILILQPAVKGSVDFPEKADTAKFLAELENPVSPRARCCAACFLPKTAIRDAQYPEEGARVSSNQPHAPRRGALFVKQPYPLT